MAKNDDSYQKALQRIEACKQTGSTTLNLSFLSLEVLPLELFELNGLTALYASFNNLHSVDGIEQLENLTELDLSSNKLSSVNRFDKLDKLTTLLLGNNNLNSIKGVDQLTNLAKLDLKNNNLDSFGEIRQLENLIELDLGFNHLSSLEGIEKLEQLIFLDLVNNELVSFKGIEQLSNLIELHLGNNKLNSVSGIGNLNRLNLLDLSDNSLSSLDGIEKLRNLNELNLSNNKLDSIEFVQALGKLTKLYLTNNKLVSIAPLNHLKQIRKLDLGNNPIRSLKQIKDSLLSFEEVVFEKDFFSTKSFINLQYCPLEDPPIEIAKQGIETIVKHWQLQDKLIAERKAIEQVDLIENNNAISTLEMQKILKEARDFIGQNRIEKAIELLEIIGDSSELGTLKNKYTKLKKEERIGVISNSEASQKQAQVAYGLLEYISELAKKGSRGPSTLERIQEDVAKAVKLGTKIDATTQGNSQKLDALHFELEASQQLIYNELQNISGNLFADRKEQREFMNKLEETIESLPQAEQDQLPDDWYDQKPKTKIELALPFVFGKVKREFDISDMKMPKTVNEFKQWFLKW